MRWWRRRGSFLAAIGARLDRRPLLYVAPLRGNTLYQAFVRARNAVGLDGLTFHDLRHTGQTLAAQTGATMADLMKRLGHSSMVAAKRYLHAVDGRDREIAKALSDLAAHGDAVRLPKTISPQS